MIKGDRVRALRIKHKYTHEQISERLNIAIRMVARYESGEVDPSGDVITRMADLFNVSTDYLLGRTDDPTPCGHSNELTADEQAILAAVRRGDALGAIKIIVQGTTMD